MNSGTLKGNVPGRAFTCEIWFSIVFVVWHIWVFVIQENLYIPHTVCSHHSHQLLSSTAGSIFSEKVQLSLTGSHTLHAWQVLRQTCPPQWISVPEWYCILHTVWMRIPCRWEEDCRTRLPDASRLCNELCSKIANPEAYFVFSP